MIDEASLRSHAIQVVGMLPTHDVDAARRILEYARELIDTFLAKPANQHAGNVIALPERQ
jgi:hypothetical protein